MISRRAPHGEKMIQVTIYLGTNGIARRPERIRPGRAYSAGFVRVKANAAHRITSGPSEAFGDRRGLRELPAVVRHVLQRAGVKLRASRV